MLSIKSVGSKGQNYAPARGPPKSAEGRSRGKDEGECFAPFYLKIIDIRVKMLFFWSWNASRFIRDDSWKNVKKSNFIKILTFFHHISCPGRVFPWSNGAHIKPAQSSNIVSKFLLRICWYMKYIYQKYWVKGSKQCISAGTPEISRRPVQRER